jgi:hypothetical protein
MSEDRTAAAALAIEEYVGGLRTELALLGSAESADLVHEVRDMLLDAARDDPERAFAEMERMGAPADLAGTLLAERGITPSAGIPAASWWRLGVAAVIDIAVGLAAPVLIVVFFWSVVATVLATPSTGALIIVLGLACALALTLGLSWSYWAPWRDGGTTSTTGMALARISVIKLGGARTVARVGDLKKAGLAVPSVKATSPGVIASAVLAVLFLSWTLALLSGGALDPSGDAVVSRYAGDSANQREAVSYYVDRLYQAAESEQAGADWPPISVADFTTPTDQPLTKTLAARFAGNASSTGETTGYAIDSMSNPGPGVWTVHVGEAPTKGVARRVTLTYVLRVLWTTGKGARPHTDWVLSDYVIGK